MIHIYICTIQRSCSIIWLFISVPIKILVKFKAQLALMNRFNQNYIKNIINVY